MKFTGWAPQALYLAFAFKALASRPLDLGDLEVPCLCDKGTLVRAAQAAVRLTLAPTLAMVTLASMNRFNQPFPKDIAGVLSLHFLTVLSAAIADKGSPHWVGLYPVAVAWMAFNKLAVQTELVMTNFEDLRPVLRQLRPLGALAVSIVGLLATLIQLRAQSSEAGIHHLVAFSGSFLLLLMVRNRYEIQ